MVLEPVCYQHIDVDLKHIPLFRMHRRYKGPSCVLFVLTMLLSQAKLLFLDPCAMVINQRYENHKLSSSVVLETMVYTAVSLSIYALLFNVHGMWSCLYMMMACSAIFVMSTQVSHIHDECQNDEGDSGCWYMLQATTSIDYAGRFSLSFVFNGGIEYPVFAPLFTPRSHVSTSRSIP